MKDPEHTRENMQIPVRRKDEVVGEFGGIGETALCEQPLFPPQFCPAKIEDCHARS